MKRGENKKGDVPSKQTSVRAEQAVMHRYPLELVANIAVRYDALGDFEAAAKKAVALLDACTAVLEGRGKPAVTPDTIKLREPWDMDWDHLVLFVTGGDRRDRSEPKLNDFFKFKLKKRKAETVAYERFGTLGAWPDLIETVPETTAQELTSWVEHLQKPSKDLSGREMPALIPGYMAGLYRRDFDEWQKYEKSRIAKVNGATEVKTEGKKRGRPRKDGKKV